MLPKQLAVLLVNDLSSRFIGEEVEQSNPVQISSEIMAKSRAGRIFYEIGNKATLFAFLDYFKRYNDR